MIYEVEIYLPWLMCEYSLLIDKLESPFNFNKHNIFGTYCNALFDQNICDLSSWDVGMSWRIDELAIVVAPNEVLMFSLLHLASAQTDNDGS